MYDVKVLDSVLSRTHYVALFSRESLASDLANRLSKVADVPVASEDGFPGSFAYLAKTNLCQESILEQQPRLLTKRTKTPLSLPLVV